MTIAESRTGSHRSAAIRNGVIAVVSVVAASTIGNLATMPKISGWYAALAKPWFNPPNWVFGPAWSILFLLMAIAFWRVLQAPADTPRRREAIIAFCVQLALNSLWSIMFFGLESPLLGLIEIVPFWMAIVWTIVSFRAVDRVAGWLLTPYIAWVSFAAVLNWGILSLN